MSYSKEVLTRARARLAQQKADRESENAARLQAAYTRIPRLKEIDMARELGGKIISLGSRILRTETAAITTVAMCMLYSEMELN